MSVAVPHLAINRIASSTDPKSEIAKLVGDLSKLKLMGDDVLLGTYIRPEKTKGGIIRPNVNVIEDVWQGKVGLVLKWGPTAFKDTPEYAFAVDNIVHVGEWGVYKIGDAWSLNVNGYPCRIVRDVNIRMVVDDPNIIF